MKYQGFEQSQIWFELRDFLKVSNNEYLLLDTIRREQGIDEDSCCRLTTKELALAVGIPAGNMSRMLDKLSAADLLIRIPRRTYCCVSPRYSEAYANRERMAAYIREISTTTK